ncbi:hypothetical protein RDWZM_010180 [Blomia tropicalis]|uniref:AB hydrolase-1 domain-containing protein n=1 Tax=Blomia tropicalis TaxID=40697 RepID=A0A9Q0RIT2_BLOTA|nr:hypothetical protein RDWZM_010180 [Blomia tropicalis]
MSSSKARFDYDCLETIRRREKLKELRRQLSKKGPPQQSISFSGLLRHILTILVVIIAISYAIFANYPEPPLSPILYQWKSIGDEVERAFSYRGNKIFYIDKTNVDIKAEDSLTMLYLHGFPTSSFDLHQIFGNLTRNFHRIIAPDMIGFGFSDKPRFYSYSVLDQANLIIELLKMLDLKRIHLLSHDYGDTVAQELLARQHEGKLSFEIVSLCMMNGGIFPSIHRPIFSQKLLRTPLIGTIISKFGNYYLFSISFSSVFGPKTQPSRELLTDSWKLIRLQDGYRVWGSLLTYIDERFEHEDRWVGAIRRAMIPFHFIYGRLDPVNPSPQFETHFRKIIHSPGNVVIIDDAGHYPQIELPDTVVGKYLQFLLDNRFISSIR